jgi:tetratricopeptide (TPR) repeat protein
MTALTIDSRDPFGLLRLRTAVGIQGVLSWVATFSLTVYLAMSGGGYDIVVRSELGLVVWWFVVLGVLVGVLPRVRLEPLAWLALGLLTAFLAWTWIGASWAPSHEQALNSVALVSAYVAVLAIGVLALNSGSGQAVLGGLAAGIVVVCAIALLSKLIPSLFPYDSSTKLYDTVRLSYPFDYSDGVGEFAALAVPLLLYVASGARSLPTRMLGQAGLPVVLLCLAMTVSRGGIFAAIVGAIAFYALVPDRIARLPSGVFAAAGIAALMLALLHRAALRDSAGIAPGSERHSMLAILIAVVVASALAQLVFSLLARRVPRPRWLVVSRRRAQVITALIASVLVALGVIAFAAGTVANLWHDFQQANPSSHSNQYFRLLSLAGSHRYQYWQVAIKAFDSSPFHGIGPGDFRYYWAQHQTLGEYVVNAHSLWIETLAELGIVGALLIVGFFLSVILAGVRRALCATAAGRLPAATAAAGLIAFCAAAAFDWVWQIGVIPMIAMLLAAVVVTSGRGDAVRGPDQAAESSADSVRRRAPRTVLAARNTGSPPGDPKPVTVEPAPPEPPPPADMTDTHTTDTHTQRRAPRQFRRLVRVAAVIAALFACWGIAMPLASTISVRNSQAAARRGDIPLSFRDAANAESIEPAASSPRVQTALLLEKIGEIHRARQVLAAALRLDPLNSTTWLTASRLATEAGDADAALADYRRAKALNPTSPIFGG